MDEKVDTEKQKTDNKELIDAVADSVANKLEENSVNAHRKNIALEMHSKIQEQNLEEDFELSRIGMSDQFARLKAFKERDNLSLSDEDLNDLHSCAVSLGSAEDKYRKKMKSINTPKPKTKQANYTPSYDRLRGDDTPTDHLVDSINDISQNYPSSQREIEHMTDLNRCRAAEVNNWKNAQVNTGGDGYSGDRNAKAYLTYNDKYHSIASDLDPKNGRNYVYKPDTLTKECFEDYHGKNNRFMDEAAKFASAESAHNELNGHFNEIEMNESIDTSVIMTL